MILLFPGKQNGALYAIAATVGGLRINVYPSVMPLLEQMGLVDERSASRIVHCDGRALSLTAVWRAVAKADEAEGA